MIITSEAKNYVFIGLLVINMGSLALTIYCLIKFFRDGSANHRFYFRNTAVGLLTLFHLVVVAFVVADLVMAWAVSTSSKTGYTALMAMNVAEVTLIEMILFCMSGYFLNVMPGFMQGRLGSTTSFILQHGPRLSLCIFSICIIVNAVTFRFLSDSPVMAFLIARLEMLLVFLITISHGTVINLNLGKLIRSCRESKRLDQGQIQAMQQFQKILLVGSAFLVAVPIIQITETCLFWDYYMHFAYDGAPFSGADVYPVHFAAPFVGTLICSIFLLKEASAAAPKKIEPKTDHFTTNPTDNSHSRRKAEGVNATQMVNAALQNWVESESHSAV